MVNTSLTKLEPGDCTPDKQTGKMSKEAYNTAEERHDLDYSKNMLDDSRSRAQALQTPDLWKYKSIDGLFRSQRTPLAELDPDSFTQASPILRNNIKGITKGSIRRLARRGGVNRISATIYEEVRFALKA
ncbi:hypothetical protein KCU91_g11804, partial [Aureobasidium melanogenum]